MKKIIAIIWISFIVFSLTACTSKSKETPLKNNHISDSNTQAEIALITVSDGIDDKSFNQGAWEGILKYAENHDISYQYYTSREKSTDACLSFIDLAVEKGAKVIIAPGFILSKPISLAQYQYPDIKFVLLDGFPNNQSGIHDSENVNKNSVELRYAEQESGFLAGYAAVKDGYRNLGFIGEMNIPPIIRYGYGFVQGAEYAAKELSLPSDSISINYNYSDDFLESSKIQAMASKWYKSGTEVIFSCGGLISTSVIAAAEACNGKVIGSCIDNSAESKTVITSATKNLSQSVYDILNLYYSDKFPGGQRRILNASSRSIGLAISTGRFNSFTKSDYDIIYSKLASNENGIASSILEDNDIKSVLDIPLSATKINEIK